MLSQNLAAQVAAPTPLTPLLTQQGYLIVSRENLGLNLDQS
jgi:hypothetical protein